MRRKSGWVREREGEGGRENLRLWLLSRPFPHICFRNRQSALVLRKFHAKQRRGETISKINNRFSAGPKFFRRGNAASPGGSSPRRFFA